VTAEVRSATGSTPRISRASGEPLHRQIRRAIAAQVQAGALRPGDRLPTEHEYAREFGVSLAPVRQALLDLVAAGQLVRIKGKGTFVRDAPLEEEITPLLGFTDNLRGRGIPFEVRVLEQALVDPEEDVASALALPPDVPIVHLRRLALIRGEPAAILDACLPGERFAALADAPGFDAGQSLYRRLETDFGVRLRGAEGTLRVARCDEEQADLLDVAPGAAALLVESIARDVDGVPVEFARVLYRADRFAFRIDRPRVHG
jgi:GntR family transcriptional regulator